MIDVVIAVTRLLQNCFPLPDWRNGDDVGAWLTRIAVPLGHLIAILVRRLGAINVAQLSEELASDEARQKLAQFDPKMVDAALQLILLIDDLNQR